MTQYKQKENVSTFHDTLDLSSKWKKIQMCMYAELCLQKCVFVSLCSFECEHLCVDCSINGRSSTFGLTPMGTIA